MTAQARVVSFVPLLAERFARERLAALAQVRGVVVKQIPEVLFVCVHNAGRSQMVQLEDPAGKSVEDVRTIRDEIDRRVQNLLSELLVRSTG